MKFFKFLPILLICLMLSACNKSDIKLPIKETTESILSKANENIKNTKNLEYTLILNLNAKSDFNEINLKNIIDAILFLEKNKEKAKLTTNTIVNSLNKSKSISYLINDNKNLYSLKFLTSENDWKQRMLNNYLFYYLFNTYSKNFSLSAYLDFADRFYIKVLDKDYILSAEFEGNDLKTILTKTGVLKTITSLGYFLDDDFKKTTIKLKFDRNNFFLKNIYIDLSNLIGFKINKYLDTDLIPLFNNFTINCNLEYSYHNYNSALDFKSPLKINQ